MVAGMDGEGREGFGGCRGGRGEGGKSEEEKGWSEKEKEGEEGVVGTGALALFDDEMGVPLRVRYYRV